ncbi:hypothetical protein [Frigoriflavimonas asaccharolytica]|uniref:Uncharacterized protein n=1 Tax=Frigoriflavimonas asaccharolytica TaxID=2735899 RepID=A0A8J8GAG4_9FLAO|nr:hypothetical protein [Frigoriflavimonas asaccharolytica]NRS92365.1 hypothetical protein [Frigoriflavimonas asaccharolytica]
MNDSKIFEVDYFFSAKIMRQLNLKETSNVFLAESKNLLKKIGDNHVYDLVIIGTAHRYFNIFLKISSHYKTSIVVHNVNFSQLKRRRLFFNVFKKECIFRLKLLFFEGLLSKNKLHKDANNLFILDENLNIAKDQFTYLPIFYTAQIEEEINPDISIVIPGSVSQSRRNYREVLKKLEVFGKNNSKKYPKVEIVFLGKAQNEELNWLIKFEKNNFENLKIVYFKEKVSQIDFDFYMHSATFLWCPLQISTEFFSNKEFYNDTKMSGIVGDAIKYQKIAFLPKEFSRNYPFILNNEGELEDQISTFYNLKQKKYFAAFEKAKVLKDLENTLENLF